MTRLRPDDGRLQTPVAHLVCNFAEGVDGKPPLLTHDDVTTLFHEFGHGLHGLLSDVTYECMWLGIAKVKNGAGEYTALDATSVSKALEGASVPDTGNDLKVKYDFANTTPGAYPITALSYEIVCSKGTDAGKLALLKAFLTYDVTTGQSAADALGFAPLPQSIADKVKAAVDGLA